MTRENTPMQTPANGMGSLLPPPLPSAMVQGMR